MRYLIAALALTALVAGCGSSSNTKSSPTSAATQAPAVTKAASVSSPAAVGQAPAPGASKAPSAPTQPAASSTAKPFTIVESAYNLVPQTVSPGKFYLLWVAVIENPNDAQYGTFPVITVTARDDSGAVLGTADQTLGDFPPGTKIAFAGQIDTTAQPTKVEFTPGKVKWQPTKTKAADYIPFAASNVTLKPDPIYGYVVSGDVANPYAKDGDLAVTALLRDDSGKLVGGETEFVNGVTAKGSHPFKSDTGKTSAPATKAEVMAMPWEFAITWEQLLVAK
jgi:hypothetical protein